MSNIKRKIVLKGRHIGVVTLFGDSECRVSAEGLHGELLLFASPDRFVRVRDGFAEIAVRDVAAAATVGLVQRGQLVPFDWCAAEENLRLQSYLSSAKKDAERSAQIAESTEEKTSSETNRGSAQHENNSSDGLSRPPVSAVQNANALPLPELSVNTSIYRGAHPQNASLSETKKTEVSLSAFSETDSKKSWSVSTADEAAVFPEILETAPKNRNIPSELSEGGESLNSTHSQSDPSFSAQPRFVCPSALPPREVAAFSRVFPDSVWFLHEFTSTGRIRHYLTGAIYGKGLEATATAVPGKPDLRPAMLKGFNRFLTDDDGTGYWVMLTPSGISHQAL